MEREKDVIHDNLEVAPEDPVLREVSEHPDLAENAPLPSEDVSAELREQQELRRLDTLNRSP